MNTKEDFLKTTVVARINNTNILASQVALQLVPVRPICKALGISYQKQIEKIKNHPVFAPTVTLRVTVAADGKYREMFCLPVKFIFGWIFTIHPDNVKESAQQHIIQYQEECCEALYNYFFLSQIYRIESLEKINVLNNRKKTLRNKPDKSEDLAEYIGIEKKLVQEKSKLGKNTRREQNIYTISFFTEKEMTGK